MIDCESTYSSFSYTILLFYYLLKFVKLHLYKKIRNFKNFNSCKPKEQKKNKER